VQNAVQTVYDQMPPTGVEPVDVNVSIANDLGNESVSTGAESGAVEEKPTAPSVPASPWAELVNTLSPEQKAALLAALGVVPPSSSTGSA
jgi:hypothetical protein